MPAQLASLAAAGVLGGGNRATTDAAQAFFAQQSPEDQAAIRASWNTPGQGRIDGGGFTARPGSKLGDNIMMNNWYTNANNAGAVPPPPPVAPPPGPAQTAPVAGPVQPAPQLASTASLRPAPAGQPSGGSTLPQPGQPGGVTGGYAGGVHTQPPPPQTSTPGRQPEWGGNVAAGATPIANMMTNNFAQPKKPFDYETAKNQFGAAEAKRMESESR